MKKIVSIVWYKVLPPVFGGQKGIASFNYHLSQHFPLVCICSQDNEPPADIPYKVLPELPVSKWQFFRPSAWKKILTVALAEKATHIILEHPYHGIAAFRAKRKCSAQLILHSHNIESERFREMGKAGWRLLRWYEKWIHRKADLVLFKTTADKDFAITNFGIGEEKCTIVPFGIEKKAPIDRAAAATLIRERHSINPGEKILLFAGTLDYKPNARAVEAIYEQLAPGLGNGSFPCKIIICGRVSKKAYHHLKSLQHPLVIDAGEVKDIANYFAAADVFINPVKSGGGIQTKNIEALSYDCNLVCFDDMVDVDTVKVASEKIFAVAKGNWVDFIKKISEAVAIRNPTPVSFFEYYYWENIIEKLLAFGY